MRSPAAHDDEDYPFGAATAPPATAPHVPLTQSRRRLRAGVAGAIVAGAALWLGSSIRHDNRPAPDVFEAGKDGRTPVPLDAGDTTARRPASAEPAGETLLVHVSGRVRSPGVYKLAAGSRVQDAVAAAGGAATDGDTDILNLAAFVSDGMRIEVPTRASAAALPEAPPATIPAQRVPSAENPPPAPRTEEPPPAENPTGNADLSSRNDPVAQEAFRQSASGLSRGGRRHRVDSLNRPLRMVNLNTAGTHELQLLPAIGPEMAARIIEYRRLKGSFRSIDELGLIDGIGEKKLERIRPYVTVS